MGENLLRLAVFFDDALMQEHHPTGDIPCETHLMGNDEHRASLFGQRAHDTEHLADQFRIEP